MIGKFTRHCLVVAVLALAGSLLVAAPSAATGVEGSGFVERSEPAGLADVSNYKVVRAPGEIIPSRVEVLNQDHAHLLTYAADDASSFMALLVIERAEAATEYRFKDAVPTGHTAVLQADGSVRVFGADGDEAGGIAAPWAFDANGDEVPTSYALEGTTLVQTVNHHGAVYPVIADPFWFAVFVRVVYSCAASALCRETVRHAPLVIGRLWSNRGTLTSGNSNGSSSNRVTNTCNGRTRRGC